MDREMIFHNRNFEYEARQALHIYDRPLRCSDVGQITELDCSMFEFSLEDSENLCMFHRLRILAINAHTDILEAVNSLICLEKLYLTCWNGQGNVFDLLRICHLSKLKTLCVSGGDLSTMEIANLHGLANFPDLHTFSLHEFGTVDLSMVSAVPELKRFCCSFGKKVISVEAVTGLQRLQQLELTGLALDNLDFLDALPAGLTVRLYELELEQQTDLAKLNRFHNLEMENISFRKKG